jgi:hypothetical protein
MDCGPFPQLPAVAEPQRRHVMVESLTALAAVEKSLERLRECSDKVKEGLLGELEDAVSEIRSAVCFVYESAD